MIWLVVIFVAIVGSAFLLKPKKPSQVSSLVGDGDYDYEIVGEASYQNALREIAGESDDAAEYYCNAMLIPEPSNEYDRKAIRVAIDGHTVGYIPRNETDLFHGKLAGGAASVGAVVVGGWERRKTQGLYGVKLDLSFPLRFD